MSSSVTIAELMATFRLALLALVPIAERSGIAWNGLTVYDSWENIECVLFESFVGSVAENAADGPFRPMPRYGSRYPSYADFSFLTVRPARLPTHSLVFLKLATVGGPFDTARFVTADSNFVANDQTLDIPLHTVRFEHAARTAQRITYREVVVYNE